MNPNPFSALIHSRKFWLLILDAIVSTITIILTRLLSPDDLKLALTLIGIYQPIFVFVIVSYTAQNIAAINKGSDQLPPIK